MKEITRIHIAQISYDIEISAKKDLEQYLHTLESYGSDNEIINDIEIRMTELLEERGIKKGGVITKKDVEALKEQLGKPSEIMGEGDMALGEPVVGPGTKKLFRDTDNPVLGGVLSGIAYFFGISPVWTRILFIILALASFGTAFLVYIVLWIAVPPAKTAADKLQMRGRAVTVQSIREFNENEATKLSREGAASGRRVVTVLAGILAVFGALGAALTTIAATIGVLAKGHEGFSALPGEVVGVFIAAFILMVISGILLATLFTLGAFAAFAQKMTRRVAITMGVIVLLGLSTFVTAVGLAQYGTTRHEAAIESSMKESSIALPKDTSRVTALSLDAKGIRVTYNVTKNAPSAMVKTTSGVTGKVDATLDGTTLRIAATGFDKEDACRTIPWCYGAQEVVINGPELNEITQFDGSDLRYVVSSQEKVAVTAGTHAHFTVPSGEIGEVTAVAGENSMIRMEDASVSNVIADMAQEAELSAGVIERFTLKSPNACAESGSKAIIDINRVTSGTITLNGDATRAETRTMACANVIIDHGDER
ncbi:PspC domain-containing protein [Streptomyces caniscabiei]|uniref:PspC domain-containing protein n=1 Tax=Streptomyces caniscabiei TaxID=2746961 RepID=UPI0029BA1D47|nr:PspC domain-containing protein [Streptomyces caniscabiei]MDX2776212.1 PspC domain-containing protein [Streptomyces caniscabiei]